VGYLAPDSVPFVGFGFMVNHSSAILGRVALFLSRNSFRRNTCRTPANFCHVLCNVLCQRIIPCSTCRGGGGSNMGRYMRWQFCTQP